MTTEFRGMENQVENPLQYGPAFNHLADIFDRQFGSLTIDFASDAALVLSQAQCDYGVLVFTDTGPVLTGAQDVEYPDAFPSMLVINNTAEDLTLLKSGETGVVVPAGESLRIASGPDDVVAATAGGGGAVSSVNGATGAVVLTAADVAAAVVSEATSARTIDPATDAGKYIRYTGTGAKTCTFDDGDGFASGEEFHIANRGASGDVTLTPAGTMTLNAPKGGSLVLEPGDTVTVKMIATDEADVMGSTA